MFLMSESCFLCEHAEAIDTPVTLFKIQIECRQIILIMYAVAQQEGDDT